MILESRGLFLQYWNMINYCRQTIIIIIIELIIPLKNNVMLNKNVQFIRILGLLYSLYWYSHLLVNNLHRAFIENDRSSLFRYHSIYIQYMVFMWSTGSAFISKIWQYCLLDFYLSYLFIISSSFHTFHLFHLSISNYSSNTSSNNKRY